MMQHPPLFISSSFFRYGGRLTWIAFRAPSGPCPNIPSSLFNISAKSSPTVIFASDFAIYNQQLSHVSSLHDHLPKAVAVYIGVDHEGRKERRRTSNIAPNAFFFPLPPCNIVRSTEDGSSNCHPAKKVLVDGTDSKSRNGILGCRLFISRVSS